MSKLNLFAKFDWDEIGTNILTKGLQLILVSVLFYLINFIGQKLISKGMDRYSRLEQTSTNRSQTLKSLLKNILRYTLLLFYIYTILSMIGIPVGTLVASAGVASLAIGLGAQGFVNDVVTGFFILFEQQFQVDDFVKIAEVSGTVVAVGLRTTELRGTDGTLHYIPNRNITIVSNFSRGHRQQIISLNITAETDLTQLAQILETVNARLYPQTPELLAQPQLLGTNTTASGNLVYQILVTPQQGAELPMQRLLLDHYLPALQEAGIKLPRNIIQLG
ncbi:mechanosensitive ion channel family protein [Lapidilactobacillus achengensis]|uniref:Mechanosensitive ion channel family protein n=1 Tax=Lapidilactobacillus achengensis TaxID=2486000 RepID=A0ABW1ULX9_9LACO|nr:mechanosensitive ion channel family protein [Lapidilactobacillus achengensis]